MITRVSTALDALNSSLSDGRGVDLDYMVSIYPEHSQAAILDELGDQILMDPESYLRGERKYLSKNQFFIRRHSQQDRSSSTISRGKQPRI